MAETFNILKLKYLIWQTLWFEISKVYHIGLQRYRNLITKLCGKKSVHLQANQRKLQESVPIFSRTKCSVLD